MKMFLLSYAKILSICALIYGLVFLILDFLLPLKIPQDPEFSGPLGIILLIGIFILIIFPNVLTYWLLSKFVSQESPFKAMKRVMISLSAVLLSISTVMSLYVVSESFNLLVHLVLN